MRKLLISIITVLMLICLTFGLTACNGDNNDNTEPSSYKISFLVEGEVYHTIETLGEEVITLPENPTKSGYNFDGWFLDAGLNSPFTAYTFSTIKLSNDILVYAKFIEQTTPPNNGDENSGQQHKHNYIPSVVKPTCETGGYTTYTCDCGDSYVDNKLNALGHKFINYISDNNATMENDGTKTAKCENCEKTNTITDKGSCLSNSNIRFMSLEVNEDKTVYGKYSNSVTTFDFNSEIKTNGTATYGVYLDEYCSQEAKTKKVPLYEGDNTFYIYAENTNDGDIIYTVTIRRKPMYRVYFNNCNVETQYVEEGDLATKPQNPTKIGYDFKGWEFDFTTPITASTQINATFEAHTYTIKFDKNGADGTETMASLEYVYGTGVNLPSNLFTNTGYSFNGWLYNENAYYDGGYLYNLYANDNNATFTFVAQWKLNKYYVNLKSVNAYTNTGSGNYDYNSSVTIKTTGNLGYDFIGWYNEENLLTTDTEYTFNIPASNVTYTARWKVKDEMANFEFYSDDDTCTITALKDKVITQVEIPNYVTDIGDSGFYSCTLLECVTFEENSKLTSIGDWAFCYCSGLTSIEIPSSVESIGSSAFWNCESLESIEIPNSVTSIGESVFAFCGSLKYNKKDNASYLGNENNPYLVLVQGEDNINVEIDSGCKIILDNAFAYCGQPKNILIPSSVIYIGMYAFSGCSSLESITFEDISTWYYRDEFESYETQIDVSNPTNNVLCFKAYKDKYWYKK